MPGKIKNVYIIVLFIFLLIGCTKRNPVAPEILYECSPTPTPEISFDLVLIDNCEDGDNENELGGYWYVFGDSENGGDSVVVPKPFVMTANSGAGAGGSDVYARITGTVTTTYQYGFIGTGTGLAPSSGIVDISHYQGMRFFAKGDAQTYRIKIQSYNITDSDYFGYNFTTNGNWEEFILPFNESVFSQEGFGAPESFLESLENAKAFQWQTTGQPLNSVDLQIDDVFLYK